MSVLSLPALFRVGVKRVINPPQSAIHACDNDKQRCALRLGWDFGMAALRRLLSSFWVRVFSSCLCSGRRLKASAEGDSCWWLFEGKGFTMVTGLHAAAAPLNHWPRGLSCKSDGPVASLLLLLLLLWSGRLKDQLMDSGWLSHRSA